MEAVHFFENGLNVDYIPNFIEKEHADAYLAQLKDLPYFTPTFKIRGRSAKPKRKLLAYGDESTSYAFSGTSIPGEPWNPMMLELRDRVERFAGCSFNYVLLNLYADGNSYISPHKDDESGLDAAFPIVVLSFGSERTLEFKKVNTRSRTTRIQLNHGSLYSMQKPTNDLFTHGIAPEPRVKDVRISLTFRHLITPVSSKKQKLEEVPRQIISPSDLTLDSPSSSHSSDSVVSESSDSPDQAPFDIDQDDWLVKYFQKLDSDDPVLAQWHLNWSTYIQIVIEKNCKLRIHIRNFKENDSGELYPSKQGVVMVPKCWSDFAGKIQSLKFQSYRESFISFNQLACFISDPEYCVLQQSFPLNTIGYFLKPTVLKLRKDQLFKLVEIQSEISNSLIEALLCIYLPKLILSKPSVCENHLNEESAKQKFLDCVLAEVKSCIEYLFVCHACLNSESDGNQASHDCLMISTLDKFKWNKQNILLSIHVRDIISNFSCHCHYNSLFFKQFNIKFYDDFFMTMFSKM